MVKVLKFIKTLYFLAIAVTELSIFRYGDGMQWPTFMSREFSYLKEVTSLNEALKSLLKRGLNHAVRFYQDGCDDKTWSQDGGAELLEKLFHEFSRAYNEHRLDREHALQVAKGTQKQFEILRDHLDYDIHFIVNGETVPGSRLLFTSQSTYFRDLIQAEAKPGIQAVTKVSLRQLPIKFFRLVEEYIYTSQIEYLWREEPEFILDFIKQAHQMGMDGLEAFASGVYKRYIDRDNVIEILSLSQRSSLNYLEKECCAFISSHPYGITLSEQEGLGLELTIDRITEEGMAIISQLNKQIKLLVLHKSVGFQDEMVKIFQILPKITGLDFSHCDGLAEECLAKIPSVKMLNISDCSWLDDDDFLFLVKKIPGIVELKIQRNTHLSFRSIGALSSLYNLTALDISFCMQIDDDQMDLLASSCPTLLELIFEEGRITDAGLQAISDQIEGLVALKIPLCKKITGSGLLSLSNLASTLEILDIRGCKNVAEIDLKQIIPQLPRLKELYLEGCDVSSEYLTMINRRFR